MKEEPLPRSSPASVSKVSKSVSPPTPRVEQWAGLCRDGLPFLFAGLAVTLLTYWLTGPYGSILPATLTAFIAWFFRDPERVLPEDPRSIVSPADGRVIAIERVKYPRLLSGEATRVSIFLSVFNVHVNRVPCSGVVRETKYHPGKFFAAYAEKASLDNEQMAVVVDTDGGIPIMFVQIAGWVARRIICRLNPGERVSRGERFGLIRFGSRMDLFFPPGTEVTVKKGDKVKGGKSVLGVFS